MRMNLVCTQPGDSHVLRIPCAIDQDPYFRVTWQIRNRPRWLLTWNSVGIHSPVVAEETGNHMAVGRNPVPLVNIKIGGKWMFIHPKMEPWVMPHGRMLVGSSFHSTELLA